MRDKVLMPPIPMEYTSYSNQEKIEKTECYYKELSKVYLTIEGIEEEYKKRLDVLLEKKLKAKELLNILHKEGVQMLCNYRYEFTLLNRLCQIAEMEEVFSEPCVLQNIHSIKAAADWYQKCIFLIRRFEFDWEEDCELADLVKQREVSYICLSELVCVKDIIQKVQTGCRITAYLYRNGCPREAVLFIMRLEQKLPYSDGKVMHFAMILLDMGERKLAYEVLMKHQNPNAEIKELQSTLSKMI